jgi:alpha-ketoglutarate-dependent taurine dioxygenase
MSQSQAGKAAMPSFVSQKRRRVNLSSSGLVTMQAPAEGASLPVTIQPSTAGVDLFSWAAGEREQIRNILLERGAILLRGFDVRTTSDFEKFIGIVSEQPLPYVERSSPRSVVSGNIYSSTDYPPQHPIALHCENSYQATWPLKIFFYCVAAPDTGGETPIADTRRILSRIDPKVRDRFADKGVLYVRNFGAGVGLSWQIVFQTSDRAAVEQYCSARSIECEWLGEDRLRTKQIRAAIRTHPGSGERLWFNHATFFHISTLDRATREGLLQIMREEDLPNNTYYGDGSAIEPDVLDHLRSAFSAETVRRPWNPGDILMLDNMLAAHGRAPFTGTRKIAVGMTEPYSG